MLTRRRFMTGSGLALAVLAMPRRAAAAAVIEIRMQNDASRVKSWYDPVGLLIAPGDTVRWILDMDVHSATAYHPKNANHSLRIPEGAAPWDSGIMSFKGKHFDTRLTVEGVYDYFCTPHENDGMVGRIVVGNPGNGPGTLPFDYFKGKHPDWLPVPPLAQKMFPSVKQIMAQKTVHYRA
ncbi:MAG TPA: plastocyanin/azurin family copper-binding protein [Candidatus Methylomirabilis sp.]|nr:plastocyanin/azurin family copper-binding protein [Candidatus Methylomirabilis sp.]